MLERRYWPLVGAIAGLLIGLGDGIFFVLLGLEVSFREADPTALILGSYALTIGVLGFAVGRWLQARKDLQETEKLASIGRMAAGVAHEVRNPLSVIRSSAGLIFEGLPASDEDGRKAARFITEEVDRLDSFVRALLDYARPVHADAQPTPLGPLMAELETRSTVPFRTDVAGGTTASADPVLLSQLLLSLLVNAGETECETVVVRARREGKDVLVDVADDGPGIASADTEKVFEPFFTTKARGTGLGLSMAARTAEALGGSLRVVEGAGVGDQGRGACFRVRIPGARA